MPELREDIGDAGIFSGHALPRLIEEKDIKGDLHVHSTWSNGRHMIDEMAQAARGRGYHYLAVTDHSPRLTIARGESPEDLKKKKKEIDRLNKRSGPVRILFGTEVEVDMDGNLDYNSAVLSEFDIVIAAVHSGLGQSKARLTRRLVRACRNKYVNIIAHPMGVHLGKRDPYDIDFREIWGNDCPTGMADEEGCSQCLDVDTVIERDKKVGVNG